jgi:hypothetical protein
MAPKLSSNAISNIITILEIVQELSAVPVLAPLRPACGIAIKILQKADVRLSSSTPKVSFHVFTRTSNH